MTSPINPNEFDISRFPSEIRVTAHDVSQIDRFVLQKLGSVSQDLLERGQSKDYAWVIIPCPDEKAGDALMEGFNKGKNEYIARGQDPNWQAIEKGKKLPPGFRKK